MQTELFERAPVPRAYFRLAVPVVLAMVVSGLSDFFSSVRALFAL